MFSEGKIFDGVFARKKLRYKKLLVGDYVEFSKEENVIDDVKERKNSIIRPPLANIDKMFIVVASKPQPDLLLVDKLIAHSIINNIEPILVINKMDIASKAFETDLTKQYANVLKVLKVSSFKPKTLETIKKEIEGYLCIFVGQSAVGKSSLINAILPHAQREVGELSLKTQRGKNCTRESQIYLMDNGGKIADTTGFSSLELKTIEKEQLTDYYAEIKKYSADCAYNTCNHIGEKDSICAVKRAVLDGKISKERYERYVSIFNELKEWEKKRYG